MVKGTSRTEKERENIWDIFKQPKFYLSLCLISSESLTPPKNKILIGQLQKKHKAPRTDMEIRPDEFSPKYIKTGGCSEQKLML